LGAEQAVAVSMPFGKPCPRCQQVGLVRLEHVIHGGKSFQLLDCNGWGYQWRVLETGEHVPSKLTDKTNRPDRSRP
jgi:hypothetical protein